MDGIKSRLLPERNAKQILLTGIMLFMMASGLITAIAAIPVPDLAVPYAAPIAEKTSNQEKKENLYKTSPPKKKPQIIYNSYTWRLF